MGVTIFTKTKSKLEQRPHSLLKVAFDKIIPLEESKLANLARFSSIATFVNGAISRAVEEGLIQLKLKRGLKVFKPIDFKKIKVVVLDYNNTIILDKLYEWQINIVALEYAIRHNLFALDNGVCELIESGALKRFFHSLIEWDKATTPYKRGRICFENGWVYCPSTGKIYTPDGKSFNPDEKVQTLISKNLFAPMYDFFLAVRAMLVKRGIPLKEAEERTIKALVEIYRTKKIIHRGFNELLPLFFRRAKDKEIYIVTDNREEVILTSIHANKLHHLVQYSNIITNAEKYYHFPRILGEIMVKEKVEPDEILVIGDSLASDIEPAKRVPGIRTVHITLGKKPEYKDIQPDVAAGTLNDAIDYLLSAEHG